MKEVLQKNVKRFNKKQYIIFAIIIIAILAGVFLKLSDVAERKFSHCRGRIVNLFKDYDAYSESYVEYLNSSLELLDRDLNNAEKYKIFLSSEERSELSQFREFYNSFPKEEVETMLLKCELLRVQLRANTENIEKLLDIDVIERENIEEIGEALVTYKHGINESKENLADILRCDVSDINEQKFTFLETAEELVSNPNSFYGDSKPNYSLTGWSLEFTGVTAKFSVVTRFGELDDDTLEEIRDYFKNNVVLLLSDEEDLFLGKIPDAVVYEECREILKKTNIDFVR